LIAQAVMAVFALIFALLHGPGFDDENGSAGYLSVLLLQFVTLIVGGIVFLRWVYIATANVHAYGTVGLSTTPGWAIAWYFIPVANLFLPLRTMRETWQASAEPRDWEAARVPALIGWWWFSWIISGFATATAFHLDDPEKFPDAGRAAEILTNVSDLFTIAASLSLAVIVRRLTAIQKVRERDLLQARQAVAPQSI